MRECRTRTHVRVPCPGSCLRSGRCRVSSTPRVSVGKGQGRGKERRGEERRGEEIKCIDHSFRSHSLSLSRRTFLPPAGLGVSTAIGTMTDMGREPGRAAAAAAAAEAGPQASARARTRACFLASVMGVLADMVGLGCVFVLGKSVSTYDPILFVKYPLFSAFLRFSPLFSAFLRFSPLKMALRCFVLSCLVPHHRVHTLLGVLAGLIAVNKTRNFSYSYSHSHSYSYNYNYNRQSGKTLWSTSSESTWASVPMAPNSVSQC